MKAIGIQRANGWAAFVSMQNYYNLLYREDEREMLRLVRLGGNRCDAVVAARAWQAGASMDGRGDHRSREDRRIRRRRYSSRRWTWTSRSSSARTRLPATRSVSPAQIAIAWLLSKPGVTSPIFGATKREHLEDAIAALSLTLSNEEITRLEEAYQPHPATEGVLQIAHPPATATPYVLERGRDTRKQTRDFLDQWLRMHPAILWALTTLIRIEPANLTVMRGDVESPR